MLLNGFIAAVFVLLGSFRGLLSFKGKAIHPGTGRALAIAKLNEVGMAEYTIYFATVCGLVKIRWGSRLGQMDLGNGSYRTHILNPLIFSGASGLIVIQSVLSHWSGALFMCCFFATGTVVYKSSWWQLLDTRNLADAVP